ncbi:MAG: hypothetical protein LBH75_03675 [Treponema sp.]|jgi:hypothetical protein|nr:hypothetical protein [Treponema sp.]
MSKNRLVRHASTRTVALLFLLTVSANADIPIPFFGGNNFTFDTVTTFAADLNDGSTGLTTTAGIGLWFEFTPYENRGITPSRDKLSVSLKLANSAFYAWRGYDNLNGVDTAISPTLYGQPDQAVSIWFDTFIAELKYQDYWFRVAGIEPEVTLTQASIKSVFDPVMNNRTAADKNSLPLPLFNTGAIHYNGAGGVVSVIGRDLVHLNRREVVISGTLSGGWINEIVDITAKAGSWKTGADNNNNSWVGGLALALRPDLVQTINLSLFGAVNYETVTINKNDPMANADALKETPVGAGIGYEYRIGTPGRAVIKPYAGIDFIYEIATNKYDYEIGGGLQWFFRGTSARFKRNTSIGGVKLGDVENPAGLIVGVNFDKNGVMNAVASVNEDPHTSLIPHLGGFFQVEFMNILRKDYTAPDGKTYSDFLWASVAQIEYLVHDRAMPYIFVHYTPASSYVSTPVYGKDLVTLTTKAGCRFTPINHFSIDAWYERTDMKDATGRWMFDDGLLSVSFGISL